jgi:hypothetical protein
MTKHNSDPVLMERQRYAFLPQVFVWRGQRYDVRQVERCWARARGAGEQRQEQRFFRVRCDRGVFDLRHDLRANVWSMARSRLAQPEPEERSRWSSACFGVIFRAIRGPVVLT